jgi:hypothetical protein
MRRLHGPGRARRHWPRRFLLIITIVVVAALIVLGFIVVTAN